jgi:hypothetical protein
VSQSDYVIQERARVSSRKKAEGERAQKRLEMDAHLNVNAGKWRYIRPGE